MIITGLLDLHSAIRYAIVILLAGSLFTAYRGLIKNQAYTGGIHKLHLSTRVLLNIQMLIGLTLYVMKGYYHTWTNLSNLPDMIGFFAIGHIVVMFIGISLVNIGYQRAIKAETDQAKYKRIAIFYTIGCLLIFLMIPWPFMHSWATWF